MTSAPHGEPEKTRWGLLLVGLTVTAAVVWFEWFSAPTNESAIVEATDRSRSATSIASPPRDFVADLTARGIDAAINPASAITRASLHDTVERPLFAMSRRQPVAPPPVIEPPPAPPPLPDPKDLKLVGVMIGRDGAIALLRVKGRRETFSVRRGEIIDGWTIKQISAREMQVSKQTLDATIQVSSTSPHNPSSYNGQSATPGMPLEENETYRDGSQSPNERDQDGSSTSSEGARSEGGPIIDRTDGQYEDPNNPSTDPGSVRANGYPQSER